MPSNREIEKLFDQWNPNGIRAGDRVQVSNSQKYQARVVGLDLDMKNKKGHGRDPVYYYDESIRKLKTRGK